jgi:hypothetical protein
MVKRYIRSDGGGKNICCSPRIKNRKTIYSATANIYGAYRAIARGLSECSLFIKTSYRIKTSGNAIADSLVRSPHAKHAAERKGRESIYNKNAPSRKAALRGSDLADMYVTASVFMG